MGPRMAQTTMTQTAPANAHFDPSQVETLDEQ